MTWEVFIRYFQDSYRSFSDDSQIYPRHSCRQFGVLVGDNEIGQVRYNGRRKTFPRLPFARKEAEMIGRLLGI